jgi:pimeloyl-ACP methyl ester carboxylesterase
MVERVILAAEEWGDPMAAPVVCLHGATGARGIYRRIARDYLADRRVLALDLRGHGRSGSEPPWRVETNDRLRRWFAGAFADPLRTVIVPGEHYVMLDAPDATGTALRDFLSTDAST